MNTRIPINYAVKLMVKPVKSNDIGECKIAEVLHHKL